MDKVTQEHIHEKRPFFTGELDDKKGTWRKVKIATRGRFEAAFAAKSGAAHFVVVIRKCQRAWNVTRSMLLMLELQCNRSLIRL